MNGSEDKRAAASIHSGISSQLFAASLVLIGILLGLIEIKQISFASTKGILILIAILLLLLSLVSAGLGLKKIRQNGENGNWSLRAIHIYFRLQTFLNIITIILFIIILFLPDKETKEDKYEKETIELTKSKLRYDSLNYNLQIRNIELTRMYNVKIDSLIRFIKINVK